METMTLRTIRATPTGRILYNLGVILIVFLSMSLGMNVFAERTGARGASENSATHYIWQLMHRQEIEQLGKQVNYEFSRMYLFKRMQGDAATWGWDQKTKYDALYSTYEQDEHHYNNLVAQFNGDTDPSQTGITPIHNPVEYMPYATR